MAKVSPARPQPGVGVLGAGERVGDRVEVGADVEAVEPVVVGGVDDHGDVGRVDDLHQPAEEAGRAHTPRQRRDHGGERTGRSARHPRPVRGVPVPRGREGRRYAGVPHERARTARRTRRGAPGDEPPGLRARSDPTPTLRRPQRSTATTDDGDDADEVLAQYPPVVAVVVTRNPGPWLEDTLARPRRSRTTTTSPCWSSTAARDDDPTPRVAAVLPRAFVRRLDDGAGFADAANEALHAVEGATFLLLCHDDVVLDPPAVRAAGRGGVPLERRHRRARSS